MSDSKCLLGLTAVVLACTVAISSGVNVSECLANPTGKLSLDIDVVGIQGPEGPKGDQGLIGMQGQKGKSGKRGTKGSRGFPGERGPMGVAGHPGATGEQGHQGDQGIKGGRGEKGSIGVPGHPGVIGPRGFPGDTELTQDEFNRVVNTIQNNISSGVVNTIQKEISSTVPGMISRYIEEHSKCGIFNKNWRRVAHIDTTGEGTCPPGLREVRNNNGSREHAAGRLTSAVHPSLILAEASTHTSVDEQEATNIIPATLSVTSRSHGINGAYVDGLSITRGSPRKHVWTYAVGLEGKSVHSNSGFECPCATSNYDSRYKNEHAPFVGNDYYCESGFETVSNAIAWNDPLWDGEGCVDPANTCCQNFGWFDKEVPTTSDSIEVRWCEDEWQANEDFYTDIVEIWVM